MLAPAAPAGPVAPAAPGAPACAISTHGSVPGIVPAATGPDAIYVDVPPWVAPPVAIACTPEALDHIHRLLPPTPQSPEAGIAGKQFELYVKQRTPAVEEKPNWVPNVLKSNSMSVDVADKPVPAIVVLDDVRTPVWEPSFSVRLNETTLEAFNTPIVPSVVIVPTTEPAPDPGVQPTG